jgi:hypothetical protein
MNAIKIISISISIYLFPYLSQKYTQCHSNSHEQAR